MDYNALSWMSGAATHNQRLDAVQRLLSNEAEIPASTISQEDHRDVSALTVRHKAQALHTPHLIGLYLPPYLSQRRDQALAGDNQVLVLLVRT